MARWRKCGSMALMAKGRMARNRRRLAPRLGHGQKTAAERRDVLRCRARRPMEWQRERHSRRSQLVQRRSGPRARPGVSGPGVIDALQHGDAMGSVWRPAGGRLDSSGLVLSPGRRRACENRRPAREPVPEFGRAQLQTSLERAADTRRVASQRGRGEPDGDARTLAGDVQDEPGHRAKHGLFGRPRPAGRSPHTLGAGICETQRRHRARPDGGQSPVTGFDGTSWVDLSSGTTIGYAKIDRITNAAAIRRLKVTVTDATAAPVSVQISAHPERPLR